MRFLADECFDQRLVTALAAARHDISRVDPHSGFGDREVALLAMSIDGVALTHDLDFSLLAVREGLPRSGAIIVRDWLEMIEDIAATFARLASRGQGYFAHRLVMIDRGKIRSRTMPHI